VRFVSFFTCILLVALRIQVFAQWHTKVLHQGSNKQSLYDAVQVDATTVQLVGEQGMQLQLDLLTQVCRLNYTDSLSRYKILNYNKGILACSQYQLLLSNTSDTLHYAPKSNKVVYAAAAIGDTICIVGHNINNANGKRAIPHGFASIIVKGKVVATRNFWGSAIWDVVVQHNTFVIIKYNLNGTHLLQWQGNKWQKLARYKMLAHKARVVDGQILLSGTTSYKRKQACVVINKQLIKLPHLDVAWDIAKVHNKYVATGSNGKFYFCQLNDFSFTMMQLPVTKNLYDILPINNTQALISGQDGSIILLSFTNLK
jgi:hypothetical protein